MAIDPDDFLFVLDANTSYWFVTSVNKWHDYKKVMRMAFGKDGYKVVRTEERSAHEMSTGKKVKAIWLVIDVGPDPILVSAEFMGAPEVYEGGDAYTTGAFQQTESGGWVTNVVSAWWGTKEQALEEWTNGIIEGVETFGEDAAKRAEKITEQWQRGMTRLVGWALGLGAAAYLASRALDR